MLLGNAISPQQQFAYTSGKNATDSALIIDAMDLLYSGNVEGFAIVSSDSDFTPLATRLRESGKRVIGVGRRKTPKAFVEACERFVFLEVLSEADGARREDRGEPPEPAKDDQPRPIQSVLTKALNRVDTDDEDWASLSALGNHIYRTDPSFDSRSYGFGKLSDLVKAQPFVETKTVTAPSGARSCGCGSSGDARQGRRQPTRLRRRRPRRPPRRRRRRRRPRRRRVSGWRRARPAALRQR